MPEVERPAIDSASPVPPATGVTRTWQHAHELRRAIVTELRRGGPASPDGLAERLGTSRAGIAQQLHVLEGDGLVTRQSVRHGVGRPRHVYDVSPAAQGLFPAAYEGLAAGLIEAMDALGGEELLGQVFEARRRQLSDKLRSSLAERIAPDAPLVERVRELAVLQDQAGYLCNAEVDGDQLRITQHNCAIYQVASGSHLACDNEIKLFEEVLDADLVRETHIARGDRTCSYRITERARGEA